MKQYQDIFATRLAQSGALFFKEGLSLKDGRHTPYFVNLGEFNNGETSFELGQQYSELIHDLFFKRGVNIDIISGPSYKASAIAQAASIALHLNHELSIGFNYDRKEAKTHGDATGKEEMWVGKKFFDGCNVLIVDDVGTSMDTKVDHINKIRYTEQQLGIKTNLLGIVIAVDREQVNAVYNTPDGKPIKLPNGKVDPNCVVHGKRGEDAILKFMKQYRIPVFNILGITETIESLFNMEEKGFRFLKSGQRVVDAESMKKFHEYMKTEEPGYGVNVDARYELIEDLVINKRDPE